MFFLFQRQGASQPSRIIYPNGAETRFRYDIRGRTIEKTTIADGETLTTTVDYDPAGRLVATTGPDGQTVSYSYDLLNRVTSVADVSGQTGYEYNLRGNLLALSDAKGQTTRFDYDKNGRLTVERRPLGQETEYAYDAVGNLVEKREPNGNVTTYSYNDAGRLTEIDAGNATESLQTSFTYTPTGQLQSYDDGTTSATYEYDALGRKTRATVNYGAFTKSFSYSYYANGLKKSFTMPDGTSYDYTYGDNNELRTIQIPGLGSISVPSYTWNSPDSLLFPGGSGQEFSYDPLQRLQRILAKDPGGNSVLDFSYEYDIIGNIQQKVTEQGTYNYGYNAVQRLTNVDVDVPGLDDESFSYDAVGNRQSASHVTGDILHNANNELERYGDLEYAYDANGNLTEVTLNGVLLFEYTYNVNNRLVKVEGGNHNTIAEYYYDPFGRRLWKDLGGTRTYFFCSDEGLVAEYDANGIEVKSYGYRPDSTWTTDPLWLKHGGEYYFYQNDHLGTPQKLTAVNGAVVWQATYRSFGKAQVDIETITNNLRFPGQYYDVETGLHYNFQRYYDPQTTRYTQTDPIGFDGGIHLYNYVGNNPLLFIDPLGLAFSDWYLPHYTAEGEVRSGKLLRLLVPGQVAWDNAQNAARRGDYAGAVLHTGSMVGQQLLLVAMWGQAAALIQAEASGLVTSADVVADVCEVPVPEIPNKLPGNVLEPSPYDPDALFAIIKDGEVVGTIPYKDIPYGALIHEFPMPQGAIIGQIVGPMEITGGALGDLFNLETF